MNTADCTVRCIPSSAQPAPHLAPPQGEQHSAHSRDTAADLDLYGDRQQDLAAVKNTTAVERQGKKKMYISRSSWGELGTLADVQRCIMLLQSVQALPCSEDVQGHKQLPLHAVRPAKSCRESANRQSVCSFMTSLGSLLALQCIMEAIIHDSKC